MLDAQIKNKNLEIAKLLELLLYLKNVIINIIFEIISSSMQLRNFDNIIYIQYVQFFWKHVDILKNMNIINLIKVYQTCW